MTQIKRITNVNPLIQEKVNYFLDMINHAVGYAGWQWNWELESPTSLLQKIIFRLNEDRDYRLLYFDNYLKQTFFTEDSFWDSYPTYLDVKNIVIQYNQLGSSKKEEKKKLLSDWAFQQNLSILLEDLHKRMPADLINGVNTNVLCSHKLDELIPNTNQSHASFFKSVAIILVSEYFFHGYTRTEIREIISRVFSKDLSFPFPGDAKTKTGRKKHLKEGTLINQLNGFANVFTEKPEKAIVIVKVYGAAFPEKFEFRYDSVKFFGKNHPSILTYKKKMKEDEINSFFNDGDYLLAVVEISSYSHDSLMDKTIQIVRKELTFLSAVLDRDLNVDTTKNYVRFYSRMKYGGMAWSSRQFDNKIAESVVMQLKDNPFTILRRVKGEAVDWFLKYEYLFVNARKNNSLADYWLYLETMLSHNKAKKQVMGIVSSVILTNEKFIRDRRILTTLMYIFFQIWDGMRLLNVTQERWRRIIKAIRKGKILKEIRKFNYPFVNELVSDYDSKLDAVFYKKAKDYYYSILIEAYEYRNFFVHRGLEGEALRAKLEVTLPNLVDRLRWAILKELKSGQANTPFDLILDKLMKEGELLLTK